MAGIVLVTAERINVVNVKKKDGFYYGKVAIFFIIMFGFGYLPAVEPLTANLTNSLFF